MKLAGEIIEEERIKRYWSYRKLAMLAGLDPATIRKNAVDPKYRARPRNLIRIARALGIDPNLLLKADGHNAIAVPTHSTEYTINALPIPKGQYGEDCHDLPMPKEHAESLGCNTKDLFSYKISTDKQSPIFPPGSKFVIDSGDTDPQEDKLFLMKDDDAVMLNRLKRKDGEWWVHNHNEERYLPYKVEDDMEIVGRAVYAVREKL